MRGDTGAEPGDEPGGDTDGDCVPVFFNIPRVPLGALKKSNFKRYY